MLNIIGLSLIIIGWIEQVWRTFARRHLSFSPFFLTLYLIGAGILAYYSFSQGDAVMGSLEAVTTVLAFIILMVLLNRWRNPGTF